MSRRRLFVPPDRMRATPITVTGEEHHHLARVLRARPGDAITLFDGAGGERRARIVRIDRDETELVADDAGPPDADPRPAAGVSLVLHTISGYVLTPWLTSRTSRMNAVTVFVGVLLFGWLWGLWGLLLGVPILMVVKAVCDRIEDLKPVGELLGS